MNEKERAEIDKLNAEADKLRAEAKSLRHGVWIKWYTAMITTLIGSTGFFKIIKEFINH